MVESPTESSKLVARHLAEKLGGTPSVHRYWDERHAKAVYLLTCRNTPAVGISTYATVSLSDHPLTHAGKELPIRAEILTACATSARSVDKAIASAAFYVINSGYELFPGAIFPEVLSLVGASVRLRNMFFTTPFFWEDVAEFKVGNYRIAPLLGVPITDEEMAYAVTEGPSALERRFEDRSINIFDIERVCTVAG